MAKIDPQSITLAALKAEEFQTVFPAFYALKDVEENSAYHQHQKVYDHALLVLEGLESLLTLDFVDHQQKKEQLAEYLAGQPDKLSRQKLIFLATVFHDIGKAEVLIETAPGEFRAPGHELLGVGIAKDYLTKIDLTTAEKDWIFRFITAHGYVHGLIDVKLNRTDRDFYSLFRKSVGDLDVGLLFFVYADLLGSDLQRSEPQQYQARVQAVEEMIDWWSP